MGNKKVAMRALVTFLVAGAVGTSAFGADAGSAPSTNSASLQGIAQAIPIPGWQQVNTNGFGDPKELEVPALEAFNGYLYAGTYNLIEPLVIFDGARIFRSPDGVTWTAVTQPGFQDPHDSAPPAILDFVVFGNRLYASTGRGGNAAQIWRSSNGVNWAPMVAAGFGDPDIHDIAALAVYNNVIYAGARSQVSGARIYRSSTGDSNTWSPIAPAAPTMPGASVTGFAVFNGALYAMIESEAPLQIWRTTGGPWATVMNNGFGDSNTIKTGSMTVFGGYLYVGAGNAVNGAQLWRSSNGVSWAQAINPGFGDPNNQKVEVVFVFQNQLYVSVRNAVTGMEVWRSADGTLWEQVNPDGFGDSNNSGTNRSSATADFLSQLYVGTSNLVDGGELWRMLQQPPGTPTCYALTLGHTGQGSDPVATPANSIDCSAGQYVAGATISLSSAAPASGGQIQGWTGTDNDASTASTNTVTMPASAHTATVNYFTVLLSPVGDIGADYIPIYRWNEVSSATWYYLWVNGPSGKVLDKWYRAGDVCTGGVCSATPATTLAGGAHRWWIQTWSSAGYGPWTAGLSFSTTMPNRPGKATLVSPGGSLMTNNPTYTWNVSPDTATEDPATWYYLYVSGPSGYVFTKWYRASDVCNASTCSAASATPNLGGGEYAWWVQTWNMAGYGPWSAGMYFSPSLPGKAMLVSPQGSLSANNPTYTWNSVANATWYYIYISGPSGYVFTKWYRASDICIASTCSAADVTPNLGTGEYAWWVQTWNNVGYGPWSTGMHFNVP